MQLFLFLGFKVPHLQACCVNAAVYLCHQAAVVLLRSNQLLYWTITTVHNSSLVTDSNVASDREQWLFVVKMTCCVSGTVEILFQFCIIVLISNSAASVFFQMNKRVNEWNGEPLISRKETEKQLLDHTRLF